LELFWPLKQLYFRSFTTLVLKCLSCYRWWKWIGGHALVCLHRLWEHLVIIIHGLRANMKGCKSQQHKCRKESLEKNMFIIKRTKEVEGREERNARSKQRCKLGLWYLANELCICVMYKRKVFLFWLNQLVLMWSLLNIYGFLLLIFGIITRLYHFRFTIIVVLLLASCTCHVRISATSKFIIHVAYIDGIQGQCMCLFMYLC